MPIYTQSEDKGMTAFQERGGKGGIYSYQYLYREQEAREQEASGWHPDSRRVIAGTLGVSSAREQETSGWHADLEDLGFPDPQGAITRLACLLSHA